MNRTNIEWVKNPDGTQGVTWNPITGCLNGCPYCYARKLANTRLRERYLANKNWSTKTPQSLAHDHYPNLDPFYPRFWEDRECEPIRRNIYKGKPHKERGIFTCDMSDLFGIGIPEEWTKHILATIQCCPIDRFYLLTKQPQNLIKFSPFPDNCWVGVTATDEHFAFKALSQFLQIDAKVKFLSIEPLLASMSHLTDYCLIQAGINWLIIGAQTKPTVYPKLEWVEEIVRAADRASIPTFLKDNLEPLIPSREPFGYWQELVKDGGISEFELRQELPI